MSETWNTKFGPRRVRRDPPTLKEAITAAQGLTDQVSAQIEIAASLMDVPVDAVRAEVLKAAPERKAVRLTVASPRERGMARDCYRRAKAGATHDRRPAGLAIGPRRTSAVMPSAPDVSGSQAC